jgi:hypothetical protein
VTGVNLGAANEDPEAPGIPTITYPAEYTDAGSSNLAPALDGLHPHVEVIPGGPGPKRELTFIELGLNKVDSTQISAIACDFKAHPYYSSGDISCCRIYVRYKGGALYRYYPHTLSRWSDMVTIIRQMSQALPVTLTVGEYNERVIKKAHEIGKAVCERFDPEQQLWFIALTRDERNRMRGASDQQKAQIMAEAEIKAREIRESVGDIAHTQEMQDEILESQTQRTEEAVGETDTPLELPETQMASASGTGTDQTTEELPESVLELQGQEEATSLSGAYKYEDASKMTPEEREHGVGMTPVVPTTEVDIIASDDESGGVGDDAAF